MTLDIQGVPIELYVVEPVCAKFDWQSFGINFFLVVEPGVLDDAPQFRIAAASIRSPRRTGSRTCSRATSPTSR